MQGYAFSGLEQILVFITPFCRKSAIFGTRFDWKSKNRLTVDNLKCKLSLVIIVVSDTDFVKRCKSVPFQG